MKDDATLRQGVLNRVSAEAVSKSKLNASLRALIPQQPALAAASEPAKQ